MLDTCFDFITLVAEEVDPHSQVPKIRKSFPIRARSVVKSKLISNFRFLVALAPSEVLHGHVWTRELQRFSEKGMRPMSMRTLALVLAAEQTGGHSLEWAGGREGALQ